MYVINIITRFAVKKDLLCLVLDKQLGDERTYTDCETFLKQGKNEGIEKIWFVIRVEDPSSTIISQKTKFFFYNNLRTYSSTEIKGKNTISYLCI